MYSQNHCLKENEKKWIKTIHYSGCCWLKSTPGFEPTTYMVDQISPNQKMKTFISSISAHIWLKKMVGIWFSSQCGHYYEARLEKSLVSTFSICPPAPSSGKYEALEGNLQQALYFLLRYISKKSINSQLKM